MNASDKVHMIPDEDVVFVNPGPPNGLDTWDWGEDERDEAICPEHGKTLWYHPDQGDEYEMREHLECSATGCGYEVWA